MTDLGRFSEPTTKPPGNVSNLHSRISSAAKVRGTFERRIQRIVANVIVGQMLPGGVVKGGTAMQLRRGEDATRFTPDLDASRRAGESVDDYVELFAIALAKGWNGFNGTIKPATKPQPDDVPDDYIMSPFEIRLAYRGHHWLTVEFELGRDEVGSTVASEPVMSKDIIAIFRGLDFPTQTLYP